MPRHTHPRPQSKHPRAHTREQRERHISRRFRAAKRDGTFDHLALFPRYSYRLFNNGSGERERIEQAINDFLIEHGCDVTGGAPRYAQTAVHPDVLHHVPADLRRSVHGLPLPSGAVGALADRAAFHRSGCSCAGCSPHKQPGYRRRMKNQWERELADDLDEPSELAAIGRRYPVSAGTPKRGWC